MLMTIKLALEEAVVNVMNYAYPDNVTGKVTVDVFLEEKRLRIVITDGGRPFDPTEMADVDTTLPLEKRKVGGLGIHFIRQLMDTTDYERRDGNNVLTLTKMIKK
jgi:anti-sigma regulatory factor (Ser/Thr protein kinase)